MKYQYQEEKIIISKIKSIIQKVNNLSNSTSNSGNNKKNSHSQSNKTHPQQPTKLNKQSTLMEKKSSNKYIYNSHPNHSSPFRKPIKKSSSYYELINGTISVSSSHFDDSDDDDQAAQNQQSEKDEPPIYNLNTYQQQLYIQEQQQQTRPRVESIDDWFRQPEDWEINLKYLYKWKWRIEMEKHFRRYRKNRTKLIHNQFHSNPISFSIKEEEEEEVELEPQQLQPQQKQILLDEWNSLPHDPVYLEHLKFNLDKLCCFEEQQHQSNPQQPQHQSLNEYNNNLINKEIIVEDSTSINSPMFINTYDIGDYDLDSLDEESFKDLDLEIDDAGVLYAVYRSPVLSSVSSDEILENGGGKSRSSSINTIIERIYIDEKLVEVNEEFPPTKEENDMFDKMLTDIKNVQIPTMEYDDFNSNRATNNNCTWIAQASEACE